MAPGGEDGAALFKQSCVVRRRASDLLTERHDLAIEVIELAARVSLEALQRRRAVRAVEWKVTSEPAAEDPIAERHRKGRHQPKCARAAALIETEATKLGCLDPFPNRRDRQPGESRMAQGLSDR